MVLGVAVGRGTPGRLDVEAVALRGTATRLAVVFTVLGRAGAITAVAVVATAVAFAWHGDVRAVALIVASQVFSQLAIAVCKRVFHRVRPDGWLMYRERDLSYPSGHAATAIVFYAWLAALTMRDAGLPHAIALALAIPPALCVLGVPWSRLALGAHYATDVLGGTLFGTGWSCALVALLVESGALG